MTQSPTVLTQTPTTSDGDNHTIMYVLITGSILIVIVLILLLYCYFKAKKQSVKILQRQIELTNKTSKTDSRNNDFNNNNVTFSPIL